MCITGTQHQHQHPVFCPSSQREGFLVSTRGKMAYCKPCDRSFVDSQALHQHLQSKHQDLYCFRCQRHFPHSRAKHQHIENSSRHHICYHCPSKADFPDCKALDEHLEMYHYICSGCFEKCDNAFQLAQHDQDVHDICRHCKESFNSQSNLKNHLKTHMAKTVECPGCDRMFISSSAMVLHLEAGSCPSGVDEDSVGAIAMARYYSQNYLSDHWNFDFQCPTCGEDFVLMSALLQHCESVDGCDGELRAYESLWQFLEYLKKRVGGP